jgi:hypothetical protein
VSSGQPAGDAGDGAGEDEQDPFFGVVDVAADVDLTVRLR